MFLLDGKRLPLDRAFTHPTTNVQYPATWLRMTTLAEKEAIGITEVPDTSSPAYDQLFYWGVDNPKDHAQLVEQWVAQVKQTAGTLLAPTDWYITRQAETGSAVPQDVLDRRAEIRTYSNTKEAAITATTTTDELAAYITGSEFNVWEVLPEPEAVDEPAADDTLSFASDTSGV
jgi:hypothetical protein